MSAVRIEQLRTVSEDRVSELYPVAHDHRLFGRGHGERVAAAIEMAREYVSGVHRPVGADLSCGNGEILRQLPLWGRIYGDIAPTGGPVDRMVGPIEQTLDKIPYVDLFVLSETLEHLIDPYAVVARIMPEAGALLVTTPIDCWDDDNPEHLWAWNREGVEYIAECGGFRADRYTEVDSIVYGERYKYGVWLFT